jgi:hypothetical protein
MQRKPALIDGRHIGVESEREAERVAISGL